MFVNFNILNQLGSPAINSNTFANRPAAGQTGRLFVSTDTFEIYRDNGTTWDLIGGPGSSTITGTGTATQVAYFTSSQAIGSSANLYWDNTSGFLGVGTAAPTTRIEAVKTDGIGIYANYTTNAGSGSSATAIWAKNVTNSSGYGAVIEETTPNATAGQYPLLIKHSLSSGTAGVGMGTGVHWQLPDDAGTFKTTQLTVETINAAAATYATRYRFNVQSNGSSTPVAYLNATGLGIFTATPGAALDIHSTGTIAQLNSTGTTNNGYLAFQRTGATTFSIGDTYNGGSNYFRIFGSALSADIVRIFAATGESSFTSTETYSSGNSIGVAVQHNLTIPNAVNVGLAAIGGVNSNLNLSLGGSTTVANTGRQGLEGSTTINFTGAGTLTMTQGTTVRAFSALSSVYAFNGSAVGTITHLAGLRICFPDNVGSAVNITNNYALLINNQTTGTGTVTYTNRWGIYQEGASDLNYMAANLLLGSTVNTGDKLQVTGTSYLSGQLTVGNNTLYVDTVFNRVGIGTNSPSELLHLQSSAAGGQNLRIQTSIATGRNYIQFANGSGDMGYIAYGAGNSKFYIHNQLNDDILFATSTTVKMTLDASGNLGLGVTPAASTLPYFDGGSNLLLSGRGNIYLNNNIVFDSTFKYINNGTAAQYQISGNIHYWYNAPSGTAGNTVTLTTAMTLDASGKLGIIATNPTDYLEVGTTTTGANIKIVSSSYANNGLIRLFGTDNNEKLQLGTSASSTAYIYTGPSIDLDIYTGASQRIRVVNNGNVLIGTTTDAGQKLQVNGSSKFSGNLNIVAAGDHLTLTRTSFSTWDFGVGTLGGINGIHIQTGGFSALSLAETTGNATFYSSIKTSAPTTGTAAAWKLGSVVAAAVALDATKYIEVEVGGVFYKLAIVV